MEIIDTRISTNSSNDYSEKMGKDGSGDLLVGFVWEKE